MDKKIGYATYRRGKLHFDDAGWAMIKDAAKKTHHSPEYIVRNALLRYAKSQEKRKSNEESKNSRDKTSFRHSLDLE